MMSRQQTRNPKGAILGFVAVATILLCMLGAGIFALLMAFGGGYQMQNAVDSGALGVGQYALKQTAQEQALPLKSQFGELSNNGDFSLGNINRVQAKAVLVSANYADMEKNGYDAPEARANKNAIVGEAQAIASRLKSKVTNSGSLYNEFTTFANSNSLRMLMPHAKVQAAPQGTLETAYLDRDAESNIYFNPEVLPESQRKALAVTDKPGKNYLKGYANQLSGLRLVPFRHDERPTLVSGSEFNANRSSGSSTDLPNAWKLHGKAQTRVGSWLQNTAMVQTNPQQEFEMRMKNGWVRIVLKKNSLKWSLNGMELPDMPDSYAFRPGTEKASFPVPFPGVANVTAYVGNEDIGFTLYDVLFPEIGGGNADVKKALFQRLREMKPEATDSDLTSALRSAMVLPTAQDQTFYVYLKGDSFHVSPSYDPSLIGSHVRVLSKSDGKAKSFEENWGVPDVPNFATVTYEGECALASIAQLYGTMQWQPGTGYDGCLGELQLSRTTEVQTYGLCWPPV